VTVTFVLGAVVAADSAYGLHGSDATTEYAEEAVEMIVGLATAPFYCLFLVPVLQYFSRRRLTIRPPFRSVYKGLLLGFLPLSAIALFALSFDALLRSGGVVQVMIALPAAIVVPAWSLGRFISAGEGTAIGFQTSLRIWVYSILLGSMVPLLIMAIGMGLMLLL
jgi:hypothetical protein